MEMTCQTTLTDVGQCYSTFWYSLLVASYSTKYITRTYNWRVFSCHFWPDHRTSIMHTTVLTTRLPPWRISQTVASRRGKRLNWTIMYFNSDTAGIFGLRSTNSVRTEGPWTTGMCAAGTGFPSTSGKGRRYRSFGHFSQLHFLHTITHLQRSHWL